MRTGISPILLVAVVSVGLVPMYWQLVPAEVAPILCGSLLVVALTTAALMIHLILRGPTRFATVLMVPPILAALVFSWFTGTLSSPVVPWLVLSPLLGVATWRVRVGSFYVLGNISLLAALTWLEAHGFTQPSSISPADQPMVRLINVCALMGGVCALTSGYESARQRALDGIEETLERIERGSQTKSRILANLSHELRTPLTAILGATELLSSAEGPPKETPPGQLQRTIFRNAFHLLQLVRTLLDYSILGSQTLRIERRPFAFHKLLSEVLDSKSGEAASRGLELCLEHQGVTPGLVRGDARLVRQVLGSLIENALKFTERGRVVLRVQMAPEAADRIPRVSIEVIDTGVGILPENLELVFEPFAQEDVSASRRFGGTGLGLALCKTLVAGLGGELSVSSLPQLGSCFRVTLPTGATSSTEASPREESLRRRKHEVTPLGAPCRVLLVDVAEDTHRELIEALQQARCQVERVPTLVSACDRIRHTTAEPLDLLVLAPALLARAEGIGQPAVELRRAGFSGPVLALARADVEGSREQLANAGADSILVEPIDPDDVRRQITYHARAGRLDVGEELCLVPRESAESPPDGAASEEPAGTARAHPRENAHGSTLLLRWARSAMRWSPKHLDPGDTVSLRRGLTLALCGSVLGTCALVYALIFAWLLPAEMRFETTASLLSSGAVMLLGGALALGTRRVRTAGRCMTAAFVLAIVQTHIVAGDLLSHAASWLAFVPMLALTFGGLRECLLWSALSIALVVLGTPAASSHALAHVDDATRRMLTLVSSAGFLATGFLLTLAFEATKDAVEEVLQAALEREQEITGAKRRVLLNVTAEVQRPLLAIQGFAAALATFDRPEAAQEMCRRITKKGDYVLRYTQAILDDPEHAVDRFTADGSLVTPILGTTPEVEESRAQASPASYTETAPASPDPASTPGAPQPARPSTPQPAAPAKAKPAAPRLSGRILLAEDGLDNQRLFTLMLKSRGLVVEVAENGVIAVDKGCTSLELDEPFDLVLMDLMMPEMDGLEATRALRTAGYTNPIIALTADALPGTRERCLEAGCDEYATKPIGRDDLCSLVARFLEKTARA